VEQRCHTASALATAHVVHAVAPERRVPSKHFLAREHSYCVLFYTIGVCALLSSSSLKSGVLFYAIGVCALLSSSVFEVECPLLHDRCVRVALIVVFEVESRESMTNGIATSTSGVAPSDTELMGSASPNPTPAWPSCLALDDEGENPLSRS
jgi:hypothetical protein